MTAAASSSAREARLLADFDAGQKAALARAVSIVESHRPGFDRLLARLQPRIGHARRVGITGPPGAGKSTLTTELVRGYRTQGLTVGVVAVDPTSPFTGGALLGDRIRMEAVALDPGVFIRSMATRGSLGGLAASTREVADVLDAFGLDRILIETVGVGQTELDIARTADTSVVVLVPESGDSIQTLKAGLMEIADVFVVNKADLPGYERTVQEIRSMQNMGPKLGWKPPIIPTIASRGEGIADLKVAVELHQAYLASSGEGGERRRRRLEEEAADLVAEWSRRAARRLLREDPKLRDKLENEQAPYGGAETILREEGAKLVPGAS